MTIKAVVFDLDGVFVDSCEWHHVSLNQALKEIINYEIPDDEHYKIYNGLPTKKKLEILFEKGIILDRELFLPIETIKQQKTDLCIIENSKIQYKQIALIEELKKQGLLVGCFTNCMRKVAELILDKAGILDLLDYLVTNQDVINPKPSPEGYFKCIEFFKLQPSDCCIIEDSPKGLEAARATGAKVIAVKNETEVNLDLLERILK